MTKLRELSEHSIAQRIELVLTAATLAGKRWFERRFYSRSKKEEAISGRVFEQFKTSESSGVAAITAEITFGLEQVYVLLPINAVKG